MDVSMALALESKRMGPIKGEGPGDKITIANFCFGGSRPISSGSAAGRVAYSNITLFKYCDVSTPLLLSIFDNNDQIKKGKLFVYKMGSKQELFFSIEIFDGIITSLDSHGYVGEGGNDGLIFPTKTHAIRESLKISFAKMTVDYYIQNSDGSMKENTSYTIEVRDR
jgi:type VI secretion system Hcp family effector